MFEQMLLPVGHTHQTRCAVFAFAGEVSVVVAAALMMAWFDVVPMAPLRNVVPLVMSAPPPPPPPPAPATLARAPERTAPVKPVFRTFVPPRLTAPQHDHQRAVVIAEAETLQDLSGPGVPGGVPGGIPGGVPGGSLNDLLGNIPVPSPAAPVSKPAAAPAPTPATAKQVRVGGDVQAALLTHEVAPVYPKFASRARVEGTVELSATIGMDGKVKDLQLVDGNPLLVDAAVNAVRQWVYRPTYLNGVPVEVLTVIHVKFHLIHPAD